MPAQETSRTDHQIARGDERGLLSHDFACYAGKTVQLIVAIIDDRSVEPFLYSLGEAVPDRKTDQLDHIGQVTGIDELRERGGEQCRFILAQASMVIDGLIGQPHMEFVKIFRQTRQSRRIPAHSGKLAAKVRIQNEATMPESRKMFCKKLRALDARVPIRHRINQETERARHRRIQKIGATIARNMSKAPAIFKTGRLAGGKCAKVDIPEVPRAKLLPDGVKASGNLFHNRAQ